MGQLSLITVTVCLVHLTFGNVITFDDTHGLGRRFDGVGGLSGGGATSKLLANYPQPYRDQILDYLFKPNFGASLHILKVEIGGDVQSTDGTEASHMHYEWEENYERGYEWWLMKEAKKRNPSIKLYGLPWGFPGWVGQGTGNPYHNVSVTADYITRWVNGAKSKHNLFIDYIGIWNERRFNVPYIKQLRHTLDKWGCEKTKIIAADSNHGWKGFVDALKKDKHLRKIVYAVGVHYPGTYSSHDAQKLGMKLWSSEDYCQRDTSLGGACWARVINRNYAHGYMTSTIAWDLIASYYTQLPGWDMGLMTAKEPWNGHYVVSPPIWTSAHTTQFTDIGWTYLKHGRGTGRLRRGGTYVAFVSPGKKHLTIVLETMTYNHSKCVWDWHHPFKVEPQNVTLPLKGKFAAITEMSMWFSQLRFASPKDPGSFFQKEKDVKFVNGKANLYLGLDQIITLTTQKDKGSKGSYPSPPPHVPFPLPYNDSFDAYAVSEEPFYLSQQTGSYEVFKEGSNGFMRQMVLNMTIPWCMEADGMRKAYSVIGEYTWMDIRVEVDIRLPTLNASQGVFVGARSTKGGCGSRKTRGVFLFVLPNKWVISADLPQKNVLKSGYLSFEPGTWHKISLSVKGINVEATFDGKVVYRGEMSSVPRSGWAALGTDSYGLADFDNLVISKS